MELIDRLVRRELVRRVRGEEDRRQVFIYLTARGERVLEKLARKRLAEFRSTGSSLVGALDALIARTKKGGRLAPRRSSDPEVISRRTA